MLGGYFLKLFVCFPAFFTCTQLDTVPTRSWGCQSLVSIISGYTAHTKDCHSGIYIFTHTCVVRCGTPNLPFHRRFRTETLTNSWTCCHFCNTQVAFHSSRLLEYCIERESSPVMSAWQDTTLHSFFDFLPHSLLLAWPIRVIESFRTQELDEYQLMSIIHAIFLSYLCRYFCYWTASATATTTALLVLEC